MIDRRTFLATIGCAAATAPFADPSRAAEGFSGRGITLQSLHGMSDCHPGFAFFSGLPGNLGMPFPDLMRWFATDDARDDWHALQDRCAVTCLIAGVSFDARNDARGLPAVVARALTNASTSAHSTMPHGATLAVTMPRESFDRLHEIERQRITAAAERLSRACVAHCPETTSEFSPATHSTSVNRISEAIVAEIANHDDLTRRINAHYFAFKTAHTALRPKNVV